MSKVKKPQNLTVQDFVQRLSHLNDLIEYVPVPNPINDPGVQTPKFADAELARIVRNAYPAGWKKAFLPTCVTSAWPPRLVIIPA
jgi:hypothetical protein